MAFSRRTWVGLVVADVVLFVLAGVTSKNSSHPGTVSNIFWFAFLIGTALLIVIAVVSLVQSRRSPRTP
jgi:hypothetical protein